MFKFSDNNSFEEILDRMLAKIPDTLDKRQGSIIYDALAPAAAELAQCYISLDVYADQTYLETAVGENLDNKAKDYGITRSPAVFAQRIAEYIDTEGQPMTIDIGTRWSTPVEYGGINYQVTEEIEKGKYILLCEVAGNIGNEYFGTLLPLDVINNLGEAQLTEIHIAGEDAETDEHLRQRVINKLNETPFGGNIADYKQFVEAQDGIGSCLVIPVWNGGGTVKIVILTNSYEIPTSAKIDEIQTIVDPTQNQGIGYGKAPIGHIVTVAAPTKIDVTIECDIAIESGYRLESMKELIEEAIKDYVKEVQMEWANHEIVTIYIARIIASIIAIDGVANVENVLINDRAENLAINVTDEGNPFPVVKEVIINES